MISMPIFVVILLLLTIAAFWISVPLFRRGAEPFALDGFAGCGVWLVWVIGVLLVLLLHAWGWL